MSDYYIEYDGHVITDFEPTWDNENGIDKTAFKMKKTEDGKTCMALALFSERELSLFVLLMVKCGFESKKIIMKESVGIEYSCKDIPVGSC